MTREALGRQVREVWIEWAQEQPNPNPSWLIPWEGLSEPDREVDRRIGERIANAAVEQARAEVNAGWAAKVKALADEWGIIGCSYGHTVKLRALLTADHTAALDAVKAEAVREALLAAAAAAPWCDPEMADEVVDWLRERAERHGGGAE